MAGMAQYCNHVAAATYRIEAAVRNGLTNFSCANTANQWLSNHKEDIQPMKNKDMNLGRAREEKKRPFLSTPK